MKLHFYYHFLFCVFLLFLRKIVSNINSITNIQFVFLWKIGINIVKNIHKPIRTKGLMLLFAKEAKCRYWESRKLIDCQITDFYLCEILEWKQQRKFLKKIVLFLYFLSFLLRWGKTRVILSFLMFVYLW